jgi:ribosomal protein S18 acetylase RimI-like enzyme
LAASISPAYGPRDIEDVRTLLRAYAASLDVDLAYQGFEVELAGLPGRYAPPSGALLVARADDGTPCGCVAVRPFDEPGACEIKRLYVSAAARGAGLGRRLAAAAVAFAEQAGYRRALLDTLPTMTEAAALYGSLGFERTDAYWRGSPAGTLYFEKLLGP